MLQEIKDKLILKLNEITEIYWNSNYVEPNINWFPYWILKYQASSSNYAENKATLIWHTFTYNLLLNYNEEEKSEAQTCILVDKLINKIYEDVTLDNLIQYLEIGWIDTILDDENWITKQIQITLTTFYFNNF